MFLFFVQSVQWYWYIICKKKSLLLLVCCLSLLIGLGVVWWGLFNFELFKMCKHHSEDSERGWMKENSRILCRLELETIQKHFTFSPQKIKQMAQTSYLCQIKQTPLIRKTIENWPLSYRLNISLCWLLDISVDNATVKNNYVYSKAANVYLFL